MTSTAVRERLLASGLYSETPKAPSHYRYLAMTANFWGMAKSEKDALRNVRGAGGKTILDKHGYVLYRVHPDTEITELGGFAHPVGERPIKIADHRKQ